MFWDESLQGYWNEYQIRNYGKTKVDYNNKESDIAEDDNELEEDWKVEAEESDSEIDGGEMSDRDNERRIRARNIFNRDLKVVHIIGYCDLDQKKKTKATNWNRCSERKKIYMNIKFICTK